jgi:flagellar motility protein MotE (MotC chaperone)
LVVLFGLVARLVVSGLYLKSSDNPMAVMPSTPSAQAALAEASAAAIPATSVAVAPALAIGSMASGAALLTSASGPLLAIASAEASIPLPPGDEDLRQPQRPPSTQNARPDGTSPGTTPAPAQVQGTPQLPPNVASQNNAKSEELSRREFELNRREAQLNTREEALKTLETDVNSKLLASERSKGELTELVARNQAILDEQKALRAQQQQEDEQLKDARIEHLVTAFKGMKPEQAGVLISSMDDSVAVSILSAMPGSNAGKILAMVTPDKAARLVKSISEQRIDPKALLEAAPSAMPPNS